MTDNNPEILGVPASLDIDVDNIPKREVSQLDHLELTNGSLVTFDASHYVPNDIAVEFEPDLVTSARAVSVNNNTLSSIQNSSSLQSSTNHGSNYNNIEYVPSSMIPIQDDHHSKFADNLVHNGAEFVEMTESGLKSGPGPPIDFYLEVLPSTSGNNVHNTSPSITSSTTFVPRHEHQTPKAQLLVRAYSDFIQPNEQQVSQTQHHQVSQHPPLTVHSEDTLTGTDHSNQIMTDVLQVNFAPLEQSVISNSIESYRKPCKVDTQKRPLQVHVTQRQLQAMSKCHLEEKVDSPNPKVLLDHQPQHVVGHGDGVLSPQMQTVQDHHGHTFVSVHQHPQRYQIVQKTYTQQHNANNQDFIIKGGFHQENLNDSFNNQSKTSSENSIITSHSIHNTNNPLSKDAGKDTENQHLTTQHMPLVSRSGRPIRRRQEYIEYVNNQNGRDDHLESRNIPYVKMETTNNEDFEAEDHPLIEDLFEDEDEPDNSNDDHDSSGTYNSNGKKSLPHKKRIAKKLKNAKKNKVIKCLECDLHFTNYSQYTNHRTTHHSPNLTPSYSCELCHKLFDTQMKFFEHLKSHYEPNKKHKCEVCSGEFSSLESLQEHLTMHSREHYQCCICHKTFRKESLLEFHINNSHRENSEEQSPEKHYTCASCPKSFRTQMTLDSHILDEHSENPTEFNCEDCYRVFKTKAKLASHRKVEHKEELTQAKTTTRKKGKASKTVKGNYPCTMCPRTFGHKNSLIYHIRSHTGERPHQCEQCGKGFFAAGALKVHLRRHSGEKPYKCQHCEKHFRQWGDLRYHTSSAHSDARQFQCEFCGKDFKRKYCLVVHRRIHTGEKKYVCDVCEKSFRASSYLKDHRRIHTGERPYPCPDCGKPFRVRSDMRRHRSTHMRDNGSSASSNNTNCNTSQSAPSQPNSAPTQSASQLQANPETTQSHHPTILGRSSSNHSQVQILQGAVSQGSVIFAEGVQTVLGENNQPIRIVVSGLPAQSSMHTNHPPPAHRHSQISTNSNVSSGASQINPNPACANSNSESSSALSSDVLIMDEGGNHCVFVLENS